MKGFELFDPKGFFKGIRLMDKEQARKQKYQARYGIKFRKFWRGYPKFWFILWTPIYHNGRGPYISIGVLFIAFYRGY